MNGHEMREIRRQLGLDQLQLARLIGYTGSDRNDITRIRKYEGGKQQIPLYIARLAWLVGELVGDAAQEPPELWPPVLNEAGDGIDWPAWPGYEFEHGPDDEPDNPDQDYADRAQYQYRGSRR